MGSNIERDLLSACMLASDNMLAALDAGVTAKWFSERGNGALFSSLSKLVHDRAWCSRDGVLAMQAGNIFEEHPFALSICEHTPDWAFKMENFEGAVDVLRMEHASREVAKVASYATTGLSDGIDPFELKVNMSSMLESMDVDDGDERDLRDIANDAYRQAEAAFEGRHTGLPFPWQRFQERTFGIQSRSVCPLTGRDGVGKSRLGAFLTHHWLSLGIPILYMPFEDGSERFISNLAAIDGGYDPFWIRSGRADKKFMYNHAKHLDIVSRLPLFLYDRPATVERLVTVIARHARKSAVKGVVIDGFKDLIPTVGENQTAKEGHIMAVLVRAAKRYDVPIVSIMHLTKVLDETWLSKQSIKGSGAQSQSARMVLVYQDSGFNDDMKRKYGMRNGEIVLDCQKNNYGNRGGIVLMPDMGSGRFIEVKEEV